MLTHPTHERLTALGLTGMAKALEEQRRQGDLAALNWLVGRFHGSNHMG